MGNLMNAISKKIIIAIVAAVVVVGAVVGVLVVGNKEEPHVHEFGEWTVTKEATCNVEGLEVRLCACGSAEERAIPLTNDHKYTSKVFEKATCASEGKAIVSCEVCRDSYTEIIPVNEDHKYKDEVTKTPTCVDEGVKTYTCEVCSHEYTEKIEATGQHSYQGVVTTPATCGAEGVKTFTCSVCSDSYTESIEKTTNHNHIGVITTPAGCLNEGVETYTCSVCADTYTKAIPAIGQHNYVGVVTTPVTCVQNGVKTFTCSVCNDTYIEEIQSTGQHNYSKETITNTSCTVEGSFKFTCSSCGHTYTTTESAWGHTYADATCTSPKTCTKCGETSGESLGHTTDSGVCTRCNETIFKTLTYSGTGSKVISGINLPAGSYSVTLTHNGRSNFITKLYYGSKDYHYQMFTNTIGAYSGTHAFYENDNKALVNGMLEIKADGYWTVTIEKISNSCTSNIKGKGDSTTGLIELGTNRTAITLTHQGKSNFIVYLLKENSKDRELLVNKIGVYSGQTVVNLDPNAKYYLYVKADGVWTIDFGMGDELTDYTNNGPQISNAFTELRDYIKDRGTYSSSNQQYDLLTNTDYSDDGKTKYEYHLVYDAADEELVMRFYAISSTSIRLVAITINDELSGTYVWTYNDDNGYKMGGYLYGYSFGVNSKVSYTTHNAPTTSLRDAMRGLGNAGVHMLLLNYITSLTNKTGVTIGELGFVSY